MSCSGAEPMARWQKTASERATFCWKAVQVHDPKQALFSGGPGQTCWSQYVPILLGLGDSSTCDGAASFLLYSTDPGCQCNSAFSSATQWTPGQLIPLLHELPTQLQALKASSQRRTRLPSPRTRDTSLGVPVSYVAAPLLARRSIP